MREDNLEHVILVDEQDNPLGAMEKMEAHEKGLLHRAFSIFVFNSKGELLLQQRAKEKYHSGGLWTNTCCSHPRSGEETGVGAVRRLKEEMGISCKLESAFSFIYEATFDNGLTEHEFDHVFFGLFDDLPEINRAEVQSYKYISLSELKEELSLNPHCYTVWLNKVLDKVMDRYNEFLKKTILHEDR